MKFVLKTRANSSASQYVASSQRSSPKAISHGFPSVHDVHTSSVSLPPNGALPKLFPTVSHRFHLAPSQRSSPQAIFSHVFPSVHPVVASISPLPNRALPKLFPTVSHPSTMSTLLPSRSLPTELSPSYFAQFPLRPPLPSRSYFPRFPFCPPYRRSHLAPSQRSSPGFFPSVHPVVASISLLPQGALPKLFPTAAPPTTLSSLPSRSFPTELSPSFASTPCGLILEILNLETRWAREPESKTAHSTPFFEHVVVWAAVLWTKSM